MTTDPKMINHLWTHKTQDHPFLSDEELVIDRAEGVWVWTEQGKKLLDGFAGLAVVNVGHGRREIAEAIAEQTVRLAYYPTTRQFSNRPAAELAAKLAALTPGDLALHHVRGERLRGQRALDADRPAVLARQGASPASTRSISLEGGYHGATAGTLRDLRPAPPRRGLRAARTSPASPRSSRRIRSATAAPAPTRSSSQRRAAELREAIMREGPERCRRSSWSRCSRSGGFIIPPLGWLRAVRAICDELDVLMIADEVITGFGRTGRWFAVEHDGVVPDLMSVAKGITSGYIPLSASIARAPARRRLLRDDHAGERAPQHVRRASRRLRGRARQPADHGAGQPRRQRRGDGRRACSRVSQAPWASYPIVGEVRGRGLHGLRRPRQPDGSGRPLDAKQVAELDRKAWDRGAIVYARGTVLRLAPPLCITAAEVDELVALVADSVDSLQRDVAGAR